MRYPVVDSEKSDNEDVFAEEENNTVIRTESNDPEEIKPNLEEFRCETCDAIFFAKSHLMRHQIKVHQINHNYQCELCHKVLGKENKQEAQCAQKRGRMLVFVICGFIKHFYQIFVSYCKFIISKALK